LHDLGSTPTLVAYVVASLDKSRLRQISLFGGFEQAANLLKEIQEATGKL